MRFVLYSMRFYGEPKLSKPKELKGLKQDFSIDYIPKKCKCPIFVVGNDVWIQHKDYFSSSMKTPIEEHGAPLDYLANKYAGKNKGKKFIYGDAWGDIVLRNEAWLKIENMVSELKAGVFELKIRDSIIEQMEKYHNFREYDLTCSDMERFMEKIITEVKRKEGLNERNTLYNIF